MLWVVERQQRSSGLVGIGEPLSTPYLYGCVLQVAEMNTHSHLRRAEIEGMMAIVVKGDALDEASVKAAFDQIEEVDAVVSTVGGTPADARADSEARACVLTDVTMHAVKLRLYVQEHLQRNGKQTCVATL